MPKVRAGWKSGQYSMEHHELYCAYHYALGYKAWQDRYNALANQSKGIAYDKDVVDTSPDPDGMINVVAQMVELKSKMDKVTDTVKEVCADTGMDEYIFRMATDERAKFNYLHDIMLMPCGRTYYYELRRKFYYTLYHKIK